MMVIAHLIVERILFKRNEDYFGAHTYERVDKEGTFHTDW